MAAWSFAAAFGGSSAHRISSGSCCSASLAFFGPERSAKSTAILLSALGVLPDRRTESALPPHESRASLSFVIKFALWYVLMGWTDGIGEQLLLGHPAAGDFRSHRARADRLGGRHAAGVRRLSFVAAASFRPNISCRPSEWPVLIAAHGQHSDHRLLDVRTAGGEPNRGAKGAGRRRTACRGEPAIAGGRSRHAAVRAACGTRATVGWAGARASQSAWHDEDVRRDARQASGAGQRKWRARWPILFRPKSTALIRW